MAELREIALMITVPMRQRREWKQLNWVVSIFGDEVIDSNLL